MSNLPKVSYEPTIEIYIGNKILHKTKYINTLYIFRTPFIKAASFSLITLPLPAEFYSSILKELQEGKFPRLNITMNIADMKNKDGVDSFRKTSAGFSYMCNIIHALPRSNITMQSLIVPISFYLAQTTIHEMSFGNSFNNIIKNATAFDALKQFNDAMKSRYGSGYSSESYTTSTINTYKYPQLLIKNANDLLVPQTIINTYKPLNTLSYHFFDDFNMTGKACTGILVDLGKPMKLAWQVFTENDKFDLTRTLRYKGSIQINDKISLLKKDLDTTSYTIRDSKGKTYINKNQNQTTSVTSLNTNSSNGNVGNSDRNIIMNKTSSISEKQQSSNKHTNIYTPDNYENAKARYDNLKQLLDTGFEALYKFEIFEVHIDAISLNKSYTLDQTDLKSMYTPINIVNIFSRINPYETPVNHTAQFQCIKYPGRKL